MRRKKLANKIMSILMSAMMLVSTPMSALATDVEIQQAADQVEVQTSSEDVEDLSESDDLTEENVEEVQDEDITSDEELIFDEGGVPSDTEESEVLIGEEEEQGDPAAFLNEGEMTVTTPAADAKVSLTVSDKGVLASASDGSAVVRKEVTVTDLNSDGILTYDEALVAAHKAYNSADGYATKEYSSEYGSGVSVTKLWGVSADSSFFYLNGSALASHVGDTEQSVVKTGDDLYAAILQDTTYYSDRYASFDADTKKVKAGEELTLTLTAGGKGAAAVPVGTWNNGSFTALEGKTTDENGQVTLSFANVGTYLVTAKGTVKDTVTTDWSTGATEEKDCPIMAPACVVTVGDTTEPKVIAEGTCGATEEDNVSWKLTEDGVLTVSGTGKIKDFPDWGKENLDKIQEVRIESGVTTVGSFAFDGLTALKKVKLESGLQEIKMWSFRGCTSLDAIDFPDTLTTIGSNAFNGCTALQSIKIPASVTSVAQGMFTKCTQLKSAEIYTSEVPWSAFEGCTSLESVVLGDQVTKIGMNAFKGCGLKEITLPENLTDISNDALANNASLETVHINSIKALPNYMFNQCKGLKKVTVGKKVSELNKGIFSGVPLLESLTADPENTSVIIQDDMLYSADGKTLVYCVPQKSGDVTVKAGTESIGESAFSGCAKITGISLPESMSKLENYSFEGCTSLAKLELPATVENLNAYAFKNCTSLKELVVKGDKYVTEGSFLYTADKKTLVLCLPSYEGTVSVADGVETIGDAAFYGASKVTEVKLPSTVKAIGDDAFNSCSGLKSVEIPNGVTSIGGNAFKDCSSLTKAILPDSVTSVGSSLFKNCTALEEAVLSSGQGAVTDGMFRSCSNLKKVQIPEGITEIGSYAFWECANLQEINFPDSVETFTGSRQLGNCTSLTTVTIPDKVTALTYDMFFCCKGLTNTIIPASIVSMGSTPWNGIASDVLVSFKGSPRQWFSISNVADARRNNIAFYYGAPTDDTMVDTQPEAMMYREGTAVEDVKPLAVHMAEAKAGESYEYTWFCNSTKETISGATMLTGETVSEDGRTSQYTPDASKGGNYTYYCVIAKKDAEGNVLASTITKAAKVAITYSSFKGNGTAEDPYQMTSQADLTVLYKLVAAGNDMKNVCFQMTQDITLDTNWKPIGIAARTGNKTFGGIFDGADHTLTIAKGGKPLLGYINGAEVKNLKIYGEQIAGAGLVNSYTGVGLSGNAITIDNVRLLSGTQTLKSGLVASTGGNGYAHASAGFVITIRNCVIEEGVVVGYDGKQAAIGSFAGAINGTVENCESSATVKGTSSVGGILACRDNAMSQCVVKNSKFHGTVEATGDCVGGIVGAGYGNQTAPNGAKPTIMNCTVDGIVKGNKYVGGIFGGDLYVAQTWDNVVGAISANKFTGIVIGNEYVGAIIGYLDSLNRYDNIAGNTYKATDDVKVGIGYVKYLDTSYENPTVMEGTVVFNTGNGTSGCPKVEGCGWKANHNRTDDPLGKDADALTKATNVSEAICYELKYDGICKTEYQIGEDLDLTGLEITGYWDNNTVTRIDWKDIAISGYNKNQTGKQSVELSYGAAKLYIVVTVIPKSTTVTVTVSILGDEKHGDTKTPHGLKKGGLVTWASEKVQADTTNTVWDVLKKFMDDHKITYKADDKNSYNTIYISYVNGLGEFDNGPKSGWMYTVNGIHPNVGVADKYIQDKDEIILHYSDDYTTEENTEYDQAMVKEVSDMIHALPSADRLTIEDKAQVAAARDAYNALTDEQKAQVSTEVLARLEAAEVRIAELENVKETDAPSIHVHAYGEWKKISDATVFAPEKQERACSCGAKEIRDYGSALKAIIKVNATTVPLKVKQKTSAFKVTGLAKGDSVQSYKSSNTKIFTVTKSGVLKAGKKTGKATLTITLASGLQKKVTVKVQKKTVTTSKITGLQKKVTLKKGKKLTLKPSLTPITSTQKFTYKSSNKKIATVSSKGVIKGKKTGKAKITVKSGKKKYTVTVIVTK